MEVAVGTGGLGSLKPTGFHSLVHQEEGTYKGGGSDRQRSAVRKKQNGKTLGPACPPIALQFDFCSCFGNTLGKTGGGGSFYSHRERIPEEHDLESQVRKEREWRFLRNARVRKQAQKIIQKGISRLDDQIFLNRNPGMPSVVKFHPFTPCIAVADKDSICFWDWEKGEKLDYFHNGNPRYTRITAMEYLNGQDCSLLLTATDDGAIRVWKNFADLEKNPEMVTAWQGLSDMLPTTRVTSG
ncbi:UNVERIFIED_CONTAM: hypothetical protein K2H54_021951 [Gekko kuhli]